MDEQDCESCHLESFRELSGFELSVQLAASKADVAGIIYAHDLSEEEFSDRFPELAKLVQDLPDDLPHLG
ncbi:hypothetical protein H1V43_03380 [Streptomyces sp. PSKA54]|uniref:Uncharacterized protein n=1 Tax=Streptomyces himalayensis subsp. aureolus TaxID=2758039 RepID=A0A7W2CWK3_9ACTN|nr:hypothetical protein [Streptomyces himalayensis]MBA4860438.1 hypothetical protein [Streptomyces himalayensis subsp. aureolus]